MFCSERCTESLARVDQIRQPKGDTFPTVACVENRIEIWSSLCNMDGVGTYVGHWTVSRVVRLLLCNVRFWARCRAIQLTDGSQTNKLVHGYPCRSMSSPAKTCYLCRRTPLVHVKLTAPPRHYTVSVLLSRVKNRIPRCSLRRGLWRPSRGGFRSSLATERTKPCRAGDFHMCVLGRAGGHDTDQGTPPADPRWSEEILIQVDLVNS